MKKVQKMIVWIAIVSLLLFSMPLFSSTALATSRSIAQQRLPLKVFSLTQSGRIDTYWDSGLKQYAGYIDCATDEIWIDTISGNIARGTYPIPGGRKSPVWFDLRKVLLNPENTDLNFVATVGITTYRWSTGSTVYGSISKGDCVYILGERDGRLQCMYKITGTNYDKIAFIPKSSAPSISPVTSTAKPGTPSLTVAAGTKSSGTTFSWVKVSNADWYDVEIRRASDNSLYRKLWEIKGTITTTTLPAGKYKAAVAGVNGSSKRYTFSSSKSFEVLDKVPILSISNIQNNLVVRRKTVTGDTLDAVNKSFAKALGATSYKGMLMRMPSTEIVAKVVCKSTRVLTVKISNGPGNYYTTKKITVPKVIDVYVHKHKYEQRWIWYGNVLATGWHCNCGAAKGDAIAIEIDNLPSSINAPMVPSALYGQSPI